MLTLAPHKWKWRMRHGAITLADRVNQQAAAGETWDVLFCSDMLNLAEFVGLVDERAGRLPSVAYFHENQLTYPVRHEDERDYHFVLTNLTTAMAASSVWFNSAFHRDSFLDALPGFLRRMPDHQPFHAVERIRAKSLIQPQGISEPPPRGPRRPGPMRVLWAARWEFDKNPETFFEALEMLEARGVPFRLSVIGEKFRESPEVFAWAERHFADRIDRWGFQADRNAYEAAMCEADVMVSTANHEFFGVSVVEAIAAGAYPLLPRRLAYPEILGSKEAARQDGFFYDGSAEQLAAMLAALAERLTRDDLWQSQTDRAVHAVRRFYWPSLAPKLDEALEAVAAAAGRS
jgi:glycosyltransferase involved in cell wall biosynthesis